MCGAGGGGLISRMGGEEWGERDCKEPYSKRGAGGGLGV